MEKFSLTTRDIGAEEYEALRQFLKKSCGLILGDNKHALVINRLHSVHQKFGITSFKELVGQVSYSNNGRLQQAVIDAMTTHETFWFRDVHPFDHLSVVLRAMSKARAGKGEIRIWSAACSTGQEPYSIAMVVDELRQINALGATQVRIVATDVATSVVEKAALGVYPYLALSRGLSEARVKKYFDKNLQGDWVIKPQIRSAVSFVALNLMESFANLGLFDIIFVRNVLIYFNDNLKTDIIRRIHQQLHVDGLMFLGASESFSQCRGPFAVEHYSPGVVYRKAL